MMNDAADVLGPVLMVDRGYPGADTSARPEIGPRDRIKIWGVPFAPLTMAETLSGIGDLIRKNRPSQIITANTHYVMLSDRNEDLRAINSAAEIIVADGMPLVWASRLRGTPLPERVAGSDLIFRVSAEAADKGFRVFLLGGAEGVAEEATNRLTALYPGLQIVDHACPPFGEWSAAQEAELIARVKSANADILMVFLTMPRGERWLAAHLEELGVPVVFNGGASLDFAAGRIRRAPQHLRKMGLEWAYRLWLEPRRLFRRYLDNGLFIAKMVAMQGWDAIRRKEALP